MKRVSVGKIIIIGIIILLIGALVSTVVVIRNQNEDIDSLSGKIASQQSAIQDLNEKNSSANATIDDQNASIAGLESDNAKKDKDINAYKDQVSDLTSRYNELLQTKKTASQSTASRVSQYGTVAVTEKTCYLTFDDGPSENTLKILDILEKYRVKATFFVIGTNKLSYTKQIHEQGHTVALHTYSHKYSSIYRSQKAYFDDLTKIGNAVKQYTGVDAKVIRFPGGSSNTVSRSYCTGIMTALATETLNQGYVYYDWNVDSTDASGNNVPVSQIMNNIKTYGGKHKQDVVLMHDTDSKDTTVEALPQIIEFYIEKGYTFAPITVQTPQVTHGINN